MRLIDADELKKEVLKWLPSDPCGIEEKEFPFETDIVVSLMMEIEEAPTIEPKRGEWIDEADKYDASFGIHDYRCSNCNSYADEYIGGHEWYTAGKPNFCPNCGADMRGKDDEMQ